MNKETHNPPQRFVTFVIHGKIFSTSVQNLKEIAASPKLIPCPDSKAFFRGVMNYRGEIVPVVDIAIHQNESPTPFTKFSKVLIFELNDVTVGVLVEKMGTLLHENWNLSPDDTFTVFQKEEMTVINFNIQKFINEQEIIEENLWSFEKVGN